MPSQRVIGELGQGFKIALHVLELFRIDAAALLVYRAAWQHDATEQSISREAAIAKLYSSETAFDIIDQAVQIFGGLGVTRGATVERLFRHSRAFRIFDGTSEIQQLIIARSLLQNR